MSNRFLKPFDGSRRPRAIRIFKLSMGLSACLILSLLPVRGTEECWQSLVNRNDLEGGAVIRLGLKADSLQRTRGTISLQAERPPLDYRKVEILSLSSDHDSSDDN